MTKLEEVQQRIVDDSILLIKDNSISDNIARAMSIRANERGCIVYSDRHRRIETRCVLEHEHTHFTANLFYKLNDPTYIKKNIENKCDYLTTKRLVPFNALLECINKKMEDYEICDSLEITQDILNMAKSIYEDKLYAYIQR